MRLIKDLGSNPLLLYHLLSESSSVIIHIAKSWVLCLAKSLYQGYYAHVDNIKCNEQCLYIWNYAGIGSTIPNVQELRLHFNDWHK